MAEQAELVSCARFEPCGNCHRCGDQAQTAAAFDRKVTLDLQQRIVTARTYVIRNGIDTALLNILNTPTQTTEARS